MNNLYKNSKLDISLFSDTSISTTDKYTSSILNSLLDNTIHSGGALSPLFFLKSKSQLPSVSSVAPVAPKIIYKNVTPETQITLTEQEQFKKFMLTNPEKEIDKISRILEKRILKLNEINEMINI